MSLSAYPAIPLVVHDPYFSIWSFDNHLACDWTRHWTGANHVIGAMARIDGRAFRLLGCQPEAAAAEQISCEVHPTRTVARFAAGGVEIELVFTSPLLPDDLALLARPLSYVEATFRATDGGCHAVEFFFEADGDCCVNTVDQPVTWARHRIAGLEVMSMASAEQRPLHGSGDDRRIDWGRFYLACEAGTEVESAIAPNALLRRTFAETGALPTEDDLDMPRAVSRGFVAMALAFRLPAVAAEAQARALMLAYDDLYSIEYLDRKLRGYWRQGGLDTAGLLKAGAREYPELKRRCADFDAAFRKRCAAAGGEFLADLNALAYRQAIGAHKLVADLDGTPLFFSKENFSNGCIATVDVTYPSAPLFLALAPELLKGMLIPILEYAGLPRWRFPFAPHDLGTYPLANGQVYGGGERDETDQMPVEESGNLLILTAALGLLHGDWEFVRRYFPTLRKWTEYLLAKGYDPENQLCTDDFAGHLAHNANLSVKAIVALELAGRIAAQCGDEDLAQRCTTYAHDAAKRWAQDATDGDHYRLAFDRPGTWSQKYNLVWDKIFDLGLFAPEVAERELAHYKKIQREFGLPLDGRATYTKLDWIVWSGCLTGKREDLDALLAPLRKWVETTPSHVPLTDWYDTDSGEQIRWAGSDSGPNARIGFQARSVVGGLAIPLLLS